MKIIINTILLLSITISFSQKKITVAQAINLASKQSMLSQRIASEKMFLSTKPEHEMSKKIITASSVLFEKNINILEKVNLTPEILKEVTTVKDFWISYKKTMTDSSIKPTNQVLEQSDSMLNACLKIYDELMEYAEKNQTYPYNSPKKELENYNLKFEEIYTSANNIKFLSQKIALHYISYFNKTDTYNDLKFKSIIAEIDENINTIISYKKESSKIKEKTEKIENNWKDLKTSLMTVITDESISSLTSPAPLTIKQKCGDLLRSSDRLTGSYKANIDINNI